MSDDEFIYDDDDDWYWYEEDNMGLGDELAENTVHSPIMVEDPSLETVDTYSDWEYYSDDYYDDDPTITIKHGTNGERRKKRRKLSSIENIPNLSLGSSIGDLSTSMADSFKGVLWRVPVRTDDQIELYEPGKGEQVALLSDWRKLFQTPLRIPDGTKAGEHEVNGDVEKDISAFSAKLPQRLDLERSMNGEYGRYSPPPLSIENLDTTISRQREKQSQPELQVAPENVPVETMSVADSEDEEELDEKDETTIAIAEMDAVEDDKEDTVLSEKEDQLPHHPSIRVEIPTLAATIKEDALNQNTLPRKRGRKSKTATTEQISSSEANKAATTHTPTKRGRKRVLEADREDEESPEDSKRRSKRVASSATTKETKDNESNKKRTRTNLIASPREERGKRRRI